jgi:hypothetical protein
MDRVGSDDRATLQEAESWGEGVASVAALMGQPFPRADPRRRACRVAGGLETQSMGVMGGGDQGWRRGSSHRYSASPRTTAS